MFSDNFRRGEDKAKRMMGSKAVSKAADLGWKEWFFWSRGHEISGWISLHEVERQLIAFLSPESRVLERAVVAEAELRALNKPESLVLADRLRITLVEVLSTTSDEHHMPPHLLDHLKQQLAEGLAILYGHEDTRFASLMEWHNKAMFMVTLALMVVVALTLMFGQLQLFLLGAVGGLMSRMMRSLHREDLPTDYGASWTTLFLSPLLGAIAAWFGIAAIDMLGDMQVLGGVLGTIEWEMPYWNLGHTFDYAEMTYLIFPRPFMVERGHHDRVGTDAWVSHEYAKTRWFYAQFGLADRTEIEFFQGGHSINGEGAFKFLHKHLNWPLP